MILPYTLRLVCLCFASFFLIHVVLGLTAWIAAAGAMRAGEFVPPRAAARFLLGLRLLPGAIAILAVGGLCVPSYLWLEANASGERVGFVCCAAALLGAVILARALLRGARALWISARHAERCEREGQPIERADACSALLVMNAETPLMALTGVIRQRIIVSRTVLQTLSSEEFEAALEHERAHRKSHDNFKRLLLSLAPEIFPFSRTFAALDHCWARFTEWAADDEAVAGDWRRSLSLAAALVRIAQMGTPTAVPPLASSLLDKNDELSVRVERLLGSAPVREASRGRRAVVAALGAAFAMATVAAMSQPAMLYAVHSLLEHLVR